MNLIYTDPSLKYGYVYSEDFYPRLLVNLNTEYTLIADRPQVIEDCKRQIAALDLLIGDDPRMVEFDTLAIIRSDVDSSLRCEQRLLEHFQADPEASIRHDFDCRLERIQTEMDLCYDYEMPELEQELAALVAKYEEDLAQLRRDKAFEIAEANYDPFNGADKDIYIDLAIDGPHDDDMEPRDDNPKALAAYLAELDAVGREYDAAMDELDGSEFAYEQLDQIFEQHRMIEWDMEATHPELNQPMPASHHEYWADIPF